MIKLWLFSVAFLLSLIIRIFFILNGSDIADVHSLYEMGEITLRGINPYLALSYNTYPPLALYLEVITIKLSLFFKIPFYILIKFWPNLADILISLIIFNLLKKAGLLSAIFWSMLFLLNPISIIISSAHGQIDSISTLLTLLAIVFLQSSSKLSLLISALLFGLSISIKPNCLFLLPIFIAFIYNRTNLLQKILFIFLFFAPIIFLLIPFLGSNYQYILNKLFNYSGSNDFGLSSVLKTYYFYQNATYQPPFIEDFLFTTKIIFLTLLFSFVLIKKTKNIIKSTLTAYLLFLTFYFGISAQYLSWLLPFAILQKDKLIIPYTVFGLLSLTGFYMYFNPAILIVQFSHILPYDFRFMVLYAIGNLLFWLTNLIWLVKLIKNRNN